MIAAFYHTTNNLNASKLFKLKTYEKFLHLEIQLETITIHSL